MQPETNPYAEHRRGVGWPSAAYSNGLLQDLRLVGTRLLVLRHGPRLRRCDAEQSTTTETDAQAAGAGWARQKGSCREARGVLWVVSKAADRENAAALAWPSRRSRWSLSRVGATNEWLLRPDNASFARNLTGQRPWRALGQQQLQSQTRSSRVRLLVSLPAGAAGAAAGAARSSASPVSVCGRGLRRRPNGEKVRAGA